MPRPTLPATRRAIVAALWSTTCASAAAAQPADLARQVDSLVAGNPGAPGCAVGVYRGRETLLARGYGAADLEHGAALSDSSVFDVGSLAKQFTAMSVLLLVADERVRLDAPARTYLPWLPASAAAVTVRHLLHHTSGVRDYVELMELAGVRLEGVGTRQDALDVLARQTRLEFAPGTRYDYSNSNYFLLGEIVRAVGGRSLRDFAAERIFAPLGMRDTQFNDDHTRVVRNRAVAYTAGAGGRVATLMSQFEQTGDGGLLTTVRDFARWYANFGDSTVGRAGALAALHRRGVLASGDTIDYAGGQQFSTLRGVPTIQHGGGWAGYRAEFLRVPSRDVGVAVLCNTDTRNATALAQRVASLFLPSTGAADAPRFPPPAPDPGFRLDAAGRREAVGAYLDAATGRVRRVVARDTSLWFVLSPAGRVRLTPLGPGRFRSGNSATVITISRGARGRRLDLVRPTGNDESYVEFRPATPTAAALRAYAGSYYGPELDARYAVTARGDTLFVARPHGDAVALEPSSRDAFVHDDLRLQFLRSARGAVAGLRVSEGRVSDIVFDRFATRGRNE